MPRAKRALVEVDPNTTHLSKRRKLIASSTDKDIKQEKTESTTIPKSLPNNASISKTESHVMKTERAIVKTEVSAIKMEPNVVKTEGVIAKTEATTIKTDAHIVKRESSIYHDEQTKLERLGVHERKDYSTKYNAKLRTFLIDRHLPSTGTREDMIRLLEITSIDYEAISSAELGEMLKRRLVTQPYGNKESKIARLRLNDEVSRDANEGGICCRLEVAIHVFDERLQDAIQRRDSMGRANSAEKAALDHKIKELAAVVSANKMELREVTGVEPDVHMSFQELAAARIKDWELQQAAKSQQSNRPVCDYSWRESHWAGRTERELREITKNRGMQIVSTKAAMIKYLDTGVVKYKELYSVSLERICMARGMYRHGMKKSELVEALIAADVEAVISNDGEVSQVSIDSQNVPLAM